MGVNDRQLRGATQAMFPHLRELHISSSNYTGWAAGRVAADLTSLDVRNSIDEAG